MDYLNFSKNYGLRFAAFLASFDISGNDITVPTTPMMNIAKKRVLNPNALATSPPVIAPIAVTILSMDSHTPHSVAYFPFWRYVE